MRNRRWIALLAVTVTLTVLGPTTTPEAAAQHGSAAAAGGGPIDGDDQSHGKKHKHKHKGKGKHEGHGHGHGEQDDHDRHEEEVDKKDEDAPITGGSGGGKGGSGGGRPGTGGSTGTPSGEPALSFKVASFNILGSQHTAGARPRASGTSRARLAKAWLREEGTSVAGLTEGQVDQMRVLTSGGTWTSYPNPRTSTNAETAQSVAWLSARWSMVRAETFTIPFDVGQRRKQPMVLLQHRRTGKRVWVVSVHLTSGGGRRAVTERRIGTNRLIDNVRRLQRTGIAVVVTGDMNDQARFFCRFSSGTGLVSPAGGSRSGPCSPPRNSRIDWIFGSPRLRWSGFRFADDSVLDRVTDHTVPVSTVHLPLRG